MTASASPISVAEATDPKALGTMQGFPPPTDRIVAFADGSFRSFPQSRWAWSNMRQLVPTVAVWRGPGPASALPRAEIDLDPLRFTTMDGQPMTFAEAVAATYADGILVLHRGRVVYERYCGALEAHKPHIAMSVTKSFVGTLAGALVADGLVDAEAPVTRYVAELGRSAFGDASVRQVMDMTTGLRYTEVYTDETSGVWGLRKANGMAAREPGYSGAATLYDFLVAQEKQGEHGAAFAYKTVNTDVLAWILRRASGRSLADLLAERIWSQLGAEEDAFFTVDSIGTESGGGGLNTTLRDLARFGEMMRCRGAFNGRQIVAESAVADIMRGGDPEKFKPAGYATLPGWSYRSMWWVSHNAHGAYMARGIHGQSIYVDPKAETVIVRYGSHPQAGNVANDPVTLPAFMAVAKALMA
ncbi:serine hydrolase domain-containing protein [Phreatobacter sp. AB_2022a]|uniref:serine hydrolase domain-containing protein n=1 Tax=Phreatobacter sp. AB_2022a TaxID=3003134 RepID=UPI002286D103|nr:serine hydrolase [Phreatobacter sp. AB_2022a]MCZ0733854.1 serine hydrolase [Phreatobacter sp. AB_2022a]